MPIQSSAAAAGVPRGLTWLQSHFRWQIHTFWYSWLWIVVTSVVAVPLLVVLVGVVIEVLGLAIIGIWVIYRIARGWVALKHGRSMPVAL